MICSRPDPPHDLKLPDLLLFLPYSLPFPIALRPAALVPSFTGQEGPKSCHCHEAIRTPQSCEFIIQLLALFKSH